MPTIVLEVGDEPLAASSKGGRSRALGHHNKATGETAQDIQRHLRSGRRVLRREWFFLGTRFAAQIDDRPQTEGRSTR